MNKLLLSIPSLLLALSAQAADVGVSINVGQPGFYGQINLGSAPPPPVVYAQPVIIERDPYSDGRPVYLRVPRGYEQDWGRHCREYNACGRPVYFVQDEWYQNEYSHRDRHDDDDDDDQGEHGRGHGRGNHGRGHGRGHGDD